MASGRKQIVILGGGFGGLYTAENWKKSSARIRMSR
jgi:NADH dehydrogenase FAD-containing subunit